MTPSSSIAPFVPRRSSLPPPEETPFDAPTRCLHVDAGRRVSHVLGVLEVLAEKQAWSGSEADIEVAVQHVEALMEQMSS